MLVYEKKVTETINGVATEVRHLFGTVNDIPSNSDNQLVYKDADGDAVTPTLSDKYLDNGAGGITMVRTEKDEITGEDVTTETFLAVNIKKTNNDLVNIIPGGGYTPATKVLVSIRFKRKPNKTEYATNATEVDPAGAKIEATWETGEKSIVPNDEIDFSFKTKLVAGVDNTIVASYKYETQDPIVAEYYPITVVAAE